MESSYSPSFFNPLSCMTSFDGPSNQTPPNSMASPSSPFSFIPPDVGGFSPVGERAATPPKVSAITPPSVVALDRELDELSRRVERARVTPRPGSCPVPRNSLQAVSARQRASGVCSTPFGASRCFVAQSFGDAVPNWHDPGSAVGDLSEEDEEGVLTERDRNAGGPAKAPSEDLGVPTDDDGGGPAEAPLEDPGVPTDDDGGGPAEVPPEDPVVPTSDVGGGPAEVSRENPWIDPTANACKRLWTDEASGVAVPCKSRRLKDAAVPAERTPYSGPSFAEQPQDPPATQAPVRNFHPSHGKRRSDEEQPRTVKSIRRHENSLEATNHHQRPGTPFPRAFEAPRGDEPSCFCLGFSGSSQAT